MKRIISAVLMMGVIAVGTIGCADKSTSTTKKSVSTPEGSATQTTTTTTKESGNPPPVAPAK